MEVVVDVLFVCAGEFLLSCKDDLTRGVEKSGVVLLCKEDLVVRVGNGSRTPEMQVGAEDCASVRGEFDACFVQDCEEVLCYGDVGAAAGDDWLAVAENAVSVAKKDAKETGADYGLEKGGPGELDVLHFGITRDV